MAAGIMEDNGVLRGKNTGGQVPACVSRFAIDQQQVSAKQNFVSLLFSTIKCR